MASIRRLALLNLLISASLLGCEDDDASACGDLSEDAEAQDCGTHRAYAVENDPCGGLPGAGPTSAACLESLARNGEVSDCVLAAHDEGVAYRVAARTDGSSPGFSTTVTFHVSPEGDFWRERDEAADACLNLETSVHAAADLSGCQDWACIDGRFSGAGTVETCASESNC